MCNTEKILGSERERALTRCSKKGISAKDRKLPNSTIPWKKNLLDLQETLIHKTYRPGKYHSFYIHEPKRRLISAAPFRDRVVHHALCSIIEPIKEG